MKSRLTATIFLCLVLLPMAFATEWGQIEDVSFGVGSFTEHINQVQIDRAGSRNSFDLTPMLSANMEWAFNESFSLIPEFAITLPESGRGPNIKRFSYFFLADGAYKLKTESSGIIYFLAGGGLALKTLSSSGGSETLQNGTGTASFPLPDGSSTSRNLVLDFGIKYKSNYDFSVLGKGMVYNLSSSRNRSFSFMMGVNWHWDLFADARVKTNQRNRIKREEKDWIIKNK
mgnify:FL=1